MTLYDNGSDDVSNVHTQLNTRTPSSTQMTAMLNAESLVTREKGIASPSDCRTMVFCTSR